MSEFIRYFAATDGSHTSAMAWEFMRKMIRIRPVRLVSMGGPQAGALSGKWVGYEQLLTTSMAGVFINVVCCDPSRWTWIARAAASRSDVSAAELAGGVELEGEIMTARAELWTANVRNVLIAVDRPRTRPELETAQKYDAIVVTTGTDAMYWSQIGKHVCLVNAERPAPVESHVLRNAILGVAA